MIFIIGGKGFVGSAYVRILQAQGIEYQIITRENYAEFQGADCDVLINANGNSRKYMADRDSLWDFDASVRSVAKSLTTFEVNKYVFLSSGDVYPDQSDPGVTREEYPIELDKISRYGLHKYLAEQLVQGGNSDWLIVRMGGFVGPDLKKNAIYDMLHDKPVRLHPDSHLQFITTDRAAELVLRLVERGVKREIVNLGAKGVVRIGDFHGIIGSKSVFEANAPMLRYELSLDKLSRLTETSLPDSESEVLSYLRSN